MSENDFRTQCALHESMLRDIHLAVIGDERIGVKGVVSELKETKHNVKTLMDERQQRIGKVTLINTASGLVGGLIVAAVDYFRNK